MLKQKNEGKDLIYFDSGATTLKPQCVIDKIVEYYTDYSVNIHRGDYQIAARADQEYDDARRKVAKFINADEREVIFTSGTTHSANMLAEGVKKWLNPGDIILISYAEHASNVLPWYAIAKEMGAEVKFFELNEDLSVDPAKLEAAMTDRVKFISLAHVTNVIGDVRPIKEVAKIARKWNALLFVDAAQSIAHVKTDVKDLDVDFLFFSGHKIYGPTGIGILYGKYDLLDKMEPAFLGGGMNQNFDACMIFTVKKPPFKFEAGTPNIAGATGLARAIEYVSEIGIDNIHAYELELKNYAVSKLSQNPNIHIYNPTAQAGIITFNYKDVFPQDLATHLSMNGIAVRGGSHCAKILLDTLGKGGTVRASFGIYNTKEEIDKLVSALENVDILGAFF